MKKQRTRKEILKDERQLIHFKVPVQPLLLEVLLDIRDLLKEKSK